MPSAPPSGLRRLGRRVFRGGLFLLGFLIVFLAISFLYLQKVGVPQFLKQPLETKLRSRGWAVQTGKIRLRGFGMVEADDIRISQTREAPGLSARIGHATLQLDRGLLKQLRLRPESIEIHSSQLSWPLLLSNQPPRQISLNDVSLLASSPRSNDWEITQVTGRFLEASLRAKLSLTHLSAIRDWKWIPRAKEPTIPWEIRLARALDKIVLVRLDPAATLDVTVTGDGRDPASFQVGVQGQTPRAAWPEGSLKNLRLAARTSPFPAHAGESQVDLDLHVDQSVFGWGQSDNLNASARLFGALTNQSFTQLTWQARLDSLTTHALTGQNLTLSGNTVPASTRPSALRTDANLRVARTVTRWGESATNLVRAHFEHGWRRSDPWQAQWQLETTAVASRWGELGQGQLSGTLKPLGAESPLAPPDPALGFWSKLGPYRLDWELNLQRVVSPKVVLNAASASGEWQSPTLLLKHFHADLYGGQFDSAGQVNVATRAMQATGKMDFDAHQISQLLTPVAQRWLSQFTWETPPKVQGDVRLRLPVWTNAQPNWRDEVMPTIEITGQFTGSNGGYRGIPVSAASSHFALSNVVWHLPDLTVSSPDAQATLGYIGDMDTHDYRWRVDGRVNPRLLKPLFESESARRVLDDFQFTVAPSVHGEVWGRWHEPELVRFDGRIAATNFTYRGQACSACSSSVRLSDSFLHFADASIQRDDQRIFVPAGSLDLTERVIHVTNAVSTMDPDLVTKVIGPKVHAALKPYRFLTPPTVRVNGRLPTLNTQDADARFEVKGAAFHYWKLNVTNVTGDVAWRGDSLSITNVKAGFYGGDLVWRGEFDFSVPVGAELRFEGTARRADFHALMADLGRPTNQLAGSLDGRLTITSANSDDWHSWEGSGRVRLRNGFLWDIPIFGFFSPVLDKIVPGLGKSPVNAGDANFKIEQSVVRTSNLELKSRALRLRYNGNVDLHGRVDARMQAEILRDAWGVGRMVSLALWPISKAFEYKVTGTIDHPKSQPVYIPRILLWPFHPFRTIKRLFVREKDTPREEAPARFFISPDYTEPSELDSEQSER